VRRQQKKNPVRAKTILRSKTKVLDKKHFARSILRAMTLRDYLIEFDVSARDFAESICVARYTVDRWRDGKLFPSPVSLRLIFFATNGQVTPNDFVGVGKSPPRKRTKKRRT
jgi:hypothetical protein